MSIRWGVLALFAVVAAALVSQPTCVYACSCVPPGTPLVERDRSDVVFAGTVVQFTPHVGPVTSSADQAVAVFDVTTVWKGSATKQFTITTPGSSASCGITFEPGKAYLVYGRVNEGVVSAILCSRTWLTADAAEDLAALGAGQPPAAGQQLPAQLPATGAAEQPALSQRLGMVFGLLAVAAGVALILRSRKRTVLG